MTVEEIAPSIQGIRGGLMVPIVLDKDRLRIQGRCVRTNELWSVVVPHEEFRFWINNQTEMIQVAFPSLNADGREFLLSGISPHGWEELFGEDGDDE